MSLLKLDICYHLVHLVRNKFAFLKRFTEFKIKQKLRSTAAMAITAAVLISATTTSALAPIAGAWKATARLVFLKTIWPRSRARPLACDSSFTNAFFPASLSQRCSILIAQLISSAILSSSRRRLMAVTLLLSLITTWLHFRWVKNFIQQKIGRKFFYGHCWS